MRWGKNGERGRAEAASARLCTGHVPVPTSRPSLAHRTPCFLPWGSLALPTGLRNGLPRERISVLAGNVRVSIPINLVRQTQYGGQVLSKALRVEKQGECLSTQGQGFSPAGESASGSRRSQGLELPCTLHTRIWDLTGVGTLIGFCSGWRLPAPANVLDISTHGSSNG